MELLGTGRDADVYALDDQRVLRRYRDRRPVGVEADIMAHVGRHGVPVPRTYGVDGPDLIMQRIPGRTLLAALLDGSVDHGFAADVLADLHERLHAVPARVSADPGVSVLHLDLHPDNVILSPDGPVLIDWSNATEGPAALDTALSALILAQVAVDGSELSVPARSLLEAFVRRMGPAAADALEDALRRRSANPTMSTDEVARLPEAAALVRAVG